MARANIPQFGEWQNDDNVPYTVFFEKARQNRGGKLINPNDPQENPETFADMDPPAPAPSRPRPRQEEPIERGPIRPISEHGRIREENEFRNSTARNERNANESNYGGRGQRPARSGMTSAGSEQSFDCLPLHHSDYQAKVVGSPSCEGRKHVSSHGTGGKSRFKPSNQGDESPEKGAAVPKFGAWDENDPESAENFTHIFNKVREERNNVLGNISGTPKHPIGKQPDESKKCCCPWW